MKGTINGSRGATARRGGAPRAAQARPTQPLAQGWLSTVEIRTPAGTPWLDAGGAVRPGCGAGRDLSVVHELLLQDRKSTRLNSSHVKISYAVFCLIIK